MKGAKSTGAQDVSLRFAARIFRSRNYRLFFLGQGTSLLGTWTQHVAMSWLVYRLTDSAFMLGVVGFCLQIPSFVLAPLAGVFADRWQRRNLLVVTQALSMAQAFTLAYLTLSGLVTLGHLIALSLALGLINAADMPTRQSFVVEIVEAKEHLGNAIAMNSFMFNVARLVGPSVAGLVIGYAGEGICFLINGLSFLMVLVALLRMKVPRSARTAGPTGIVKGLHEGFSYAFGFRPLRSIILLLSLISLVGMPYVVLMPVFARDILAGGPRTLGFLMGASGLGALTGALYLASRSTVRGLWRMILTGSVLFNAALIAFAFSRNIALSLVLMLLTGFGMISQITSINTIIQTVVDEDKRGRVMSIYTMAFMGIAPFGSLLAGTTASLIGASLTLVINGGLCLAGGFFFYRALPAIRRDVRPIYTRLGIFRDAS